MRLWAEKTNILVSVQVRYNWTAQALELIRLASNLGFRKKRDCLNCTAKTKGLICFVVTVICIFFFAYAKHWFSHDEALSGDMRKPTFCLLTRSDTNRAAQALELIRGLKFGIEEVKGLFILCSKNKGAKWAFFFFPWREPRHEKTNNMISTRSDTNRAAQALELIRDLKFQI